MTVCVMNAKCFLVRNRLIEALPFPEILNEKGKTCRMCGHKIKLDSLISQRETANYTQREESKERMKEQQRRIK